MIIPAIKTEGVFQFSTPFDKEDINNKYYTVVAVRMLRDLAKNEEDPLNSIYLTAGLTEEDFTNDLKNDVPIISLSGQGTRQVYIPANKIIGMPALSGVKYRKKMVNINLGLIPENYPLENIMNNLRDVVRDSLAIDPVIKESVHSSSFLKSEQEHEQFMNFISEHPIARSFKSYKQQYLELQEQYNKLNKEHADIVRFMCRTWESNVNFITEIPNAVKQVMVKKIIINCVSGSVDRSFSLSDLGFKICSPIGNVRKDIFFKGFMVKDATGRTSYYAMLGSTPVIISVTEGSIMSSHLPNIFSSSSSTIFYPFIKTTELGSNKTSRATIEILLEKPMFLTDFTAKVYHSSDSNLSKFRMLFYNTGDQIIFNTTYTLNQDFTSANGLLTKDIKDALQIRGDIPQDLPDPV